jgi:hypothetical protein
MHTRMSSMSSQSVYINTIIITMYCRCTISDDGSACHTMFGVANCFCGILPHSCLTPKPRSATRSHALLLLSMFRCLLYSSAPLQLTCYTCTQPWN